MKLDMDGPVLWGIEDSEIDLEEDQDALVQDYVDELYPEKVTRSDSIKLIAHRRVKIDVDDVMRGEPLFSILERLEEDFGGDENRDSDEYATDEMEKAERVFCEVIAREYAPYRCEEDLSVEPVVVNIAQWLAENDPDLLNDGECFAHLREASE